ncbi:hypothetical protein ACQR1W_20390 [Bradyrhizobium sp. HKCCYLS1011]|uniref:hypothetical protein n=1 Tax=Bradyrhizobium sp. HKCCYLS1011 TaxID=3420733 RepID=UPI003EC03FF1
MSKNWRLSSFSGALLAAYFIPIWSIIAFRIMVAPVHGLFERPNISVALFVSDYLHLAGVGTMRAAWLLALARLTVAAFFAIFLILISVPRLRKAGGGEEALGIALGLGSLISFFSMVVASRVGEAEALRLHATELMLLLGTAIVMLVEPPMQSRVRTSDDQPATRGIEHSAAHRA